jgi:hypothetical protein
VLNFKKYFQPKYFQSGFSLGDFEFKIQNTTQQDFPKQTKTEKPWQRRFQKGKTKVVVLNKPSKV